MEPIVILIGAGALGGVVRTVLGYLSEKEDGEGFSVKKLTKSLLRSVIGGAVLGYWLQLDVKGVFFAAFSADVGSKAVWDIINNHK